MANWSNPLLTSTYTNFLTEVKDRDTDLALQFDGTTSSNIPTGAIRWNSSVNRWQKWSGSAWGELTGTYALTGLSTTGNASIGGTLGSGAITSTGSVSGTALIPTGSSAPANGLYLAGTNTIGLATNSAGRVFIDAVGELGVGTATPATCLDVALPSLSATIGNVRIEPSTPGQARFHLYNGGSVAGWLFGQKTNTDHSFKLSKSVAGSETDYLTVDTSGRVGIGTTSPSAGIDLVADGSDNGMTLKLTAPNTAQGRRATLSLYSTFEGTADNGPRRTADVVAGFNGGAWGSEFLSVGVGRNGASNDAQERTFERLRINGSGHLGLGTTAPATILQVSGNPPSAESGNIYIANSGQARYRLFNGGGQAEWLFGQKTGTDHAFKLSKMVAGAESDYLTVTTTGLIGLGTTSPTAKLHVAGNLVADSSAGECIFTSDANWNYANLYLRRTTSNTSSAKMLSMILQGDNVADTTLTNHLNIWGTYSGTPTTGSTTAGLSGVMNLGAPSGIALHVNGSERFRINSSGNFTSDANWNYANLYLRRTTSNTSSAKMLSMILQGDNVADTTLTNHLNIWGTYSGTPTTGSTTAGLSGVMNLGAPSGIALHVNGSERLRIDSSGRVGIGFTSPAFPLDVNGRIRGVGSIAALMASNGSGTGQTSIGLIREGATTDQKTWELLTGLGGDFRIRTISDDYTASQDAMVVNRGSGFSIDNLQLHTNGSERLRITSAGFLGLGNTNPATSFDVALPAPSATIGNIRIEPSTAGQARFHLYNGGSVAGWLFGQKTGTDHSFKLSKSVAGSETDYLTVDTSGRLGLGTTSPAAPVHFALPTTSATIGNVYVAPSTAGQARFHLYNGGSTAEWLFGQRTSTDHEFRFSTQVAGSETEHLRIGTSGQIGIGGANYGTSGQVLTSNGSGSAPSWQSSFKTVAWVNFDGTGTVAIRASGNVSSITDNSIGQYTVNFTSAIADANYAALTSAVDVVAARPHSYATGSVGVYTYDTTNFVDSATVSVAITR